MTPGPWRIGRLGAIVADVDPTGSALALPAASSYRAPYLVAETVSAGNRAVIAAAPELLALCRELVDLLEQHMTDVGYQTPITRRVIADAWTVIGKAEAHA